MRIIREIIKRWFFYEPNKKLIKNLEKYAEKEKIEQQKS